MRRSVDELEEGSTAGGEGGGWQSDPGTVGLDGATSHSPIWKSLLRMQQQLFWTQRRLLIFITTSSLKTNHRILTERLFQICRMFEPT